MQGELVSIITPCFNCAEYLPETIQSVRSQTYGNWEMLIVDDASNDDTLAIAQGYSDIDPRVRVIALPSNSGAAVARNAALHVSKGRYIAFLDSDDIWLPHKLEKQVCFMRSSGHPITCTSYEQIDEFGNATGKIINSIVKTSYNRLLLDCPVGNSTVVYDVSQLGKVEVPDIRKRNDDALWLKVLKMTDYIWGMPEVLSYYRIRNGSISRNKFELVKYHWTLYRQIEKLSIPRSMFHVALWGVIKLLRIK